MEVAAEVAAGDQPRQPPRLGRLDLAPVLAQLRRDPHEAERLVDPLFGLAGDGEAGGDVEQAVLVQLAAAGDGAVAQRDVVGLRSGEVLERRATALAGDQAEVGLVAAAQQDAALRLPLAEHAFGKRVPGEGADQRVVAADGEDVEVAARLGAAAQAAHRHELGAGSEGLQVGDQHRGQVARAREQVAATVLAPLVEGLEDQLLLLRPHAPHRAQPPRPGCVLEFLERRNAQRLVEEGGRLRPHALEVQQVEQRGGELGQQLLVVLHPARLDQLADLGRDLLADAGQLPQGGGVEPLDPVGRVRDGIGRVAVRADLERVLGLDLEQVGNLAEHPRDRQVIQREAPPQL